MTRLLITALFSLAFGLPVAAQVQSGYKGEIFDFVDLSKNPFQWKGHTGVMAKSDNHMFDTLRFEKMIDEHTAIYEIVSPNAALQTYNHEGELAVILPDSNPPEYPRYWKIQVVGPLKVLNALGGELQITAIKFLGYYDPPTPAPSKINKAPQVLYAPDPQYTEAARRAKLNGIVVVSCIVGVDGRPTDVRAISKPLGKGLDEEAVKAVSQYQFSPRIVDGKPVPADLNVEVNFKAF